MNTALVLAAHGAGDGSPANLLVRWHAARLARRGEFSQVVAAFHLGRPSFGSVLEEIGARRVVVVPCFTSTGYYTECVLPAALHGRPRSMSVRVTPPLGADPVLAALIARAVKAGAGVEPVSGAGVLVVGHGTRRHPRSGATTYRLAADLHTRLGLPVVAAFLDQPPTIEEVAAPLPWDRVFVVPHFIGNGTHEGVDLPRRLRTTIAGDRLRFLPPVGRLPGVTDLIAEIARRSFAPNGDVPDGRGRVILVGAGPGDPGLLTVRGRDVLRRADVVVHDRLVAESVLDLAPGRAARVDVGKRPGVPRRSQREINDVLIRHAKAGRCVVRLKGGDPFVFGRGAEEMEACRAAGVPCDVVPGVTSAFGVPAVAGIPVTLRGVSRSVAVVTGRAGDGDALPFDPHAVAGLDTIVVLMGCAALSRIAERMIAGGRSRATPVACIQDGATPMQRVVTGTLGTIAEQVRRAGLRAPVVTVIGDVAAQCYATPEAFAISAIASSTVRL